jgi:hypothetical protein
VFIPYRVTGTVTVDGAIVESFDDVKRAPVPSAAVTCTFSTTFEDEGSQVTIAGTAVVVLRGGR